MKKLDDEQLSRVLSALAAGHLAYVTGCFVQSSYPAGGCLMQVAECDITRIFTSEEDERAAWFNENYRSGDYPVDGTPEELLRALEKAGIA